MDFLVEKKSLFEVLIAESLEGKSSSDSHAKSSSSIAWLIAIRMGEMWSARPFQLKLRVIQTNSRTKSFHFTLCLSIRQGCDRWSTTTFYWNRMPPIENRIRFFFFCVILNVCAGKRAHMMMMIVRFDFIIPIRLMWFAAWHFKDVQTQTMQKRE